MPPRKRPKPKAAQPADDDPSTSGGEEGDDILRGAARQRRRLSKSTHGLVSSFFLPQNGGSNKTVADLRVEHGDEGSLRDLVALLPERHPAEKRALRARHEAQFGRWWAEWRAGSSLLLYGFGSKHDLLQKFARACTGDGACLVVNGLQPGLTAKQVAAWAAATAKHAKPASYRQKGKAELLDLIASEHPRRRVYLVIHNIDGPGLRDPAGQHLLSELAALPNVHLAASVDHVNAPLLWDLQTKDRFAWAWHHVTNYEPYLREVAHAAVPSLLVGRSDACTQQSAAVVLASLSHNAREVFRCVADAQLDPSGERGVSFQRLFATCRERFLVSNEMLLKSFLAEFKDHDLVAAKRGQDGGDLLCVPLPDEALKAVLEGMEAALGSR